MVNTVQWCDTPWTLIDRVQVNFEVIESNSGGLYLVIMDEDGHPERIFENWEYSDDPALAEALESLAEDNTAYELWDSDLCDRLGYEPNKLYYDENYQCALGTLVADNDGIYPDKMGIAAKNAFTVQ